MASLVIADGWADDLLGVILNNGSAPTGFHYHAYTNDMAPGPSSTLGSYTECVAAGYALENVTNSGWTPTTTPSGTTTAVNTPISWVITEAVTIYGYYVTDVTDAVLYWGQRFDTPVVLGVLGGTVIVEPTLQLLSPIP